MPVYYKKVNSGPTDPNLMERGGHRFAFGIRKKLANINRSSDGLELRKMANGSDAAEYLLDGRSAGADQTPANGNDSAVDSENVITKYGPIVVVRQGSRLANRPVIVTYHDIGLNYASNFESFFSIAENRLLLESFAVLHVNAPGQQPNADDLPDNYAFPSMDELAEQLLEVCDHCRIASFIGFGFGAGANVLCRLALTTPSRVDGLFLVNPSATRSTWSEWIYQKLNLRHLTSQQTLVSQRSLPQSVQDYLIWHLFGSFGQTDRIVDDEAVDLYRKYFAGESANAGNLAKYIDSYVRRNSLGISRDDQSGNFKCSVAVLCGAYSPHVDETVRMNARLSPSNSTWIKVSDCGMPLEEQPYKVAQILRLFLQGLGYTLKAYDKKRALMTGMSLPCLSAASRLSLHASGRRSTFATVHEV